MILAVKSWLIGEQNQRKVLNTSYSGLKQSIIISVNNTWKKLQSGKKCNDPNAVRAKEDCFPGRENTRLLDFSMFAKEMTAEKVLS